MIERREADMPLFGPPNVEKLADKHDLKGLIKALGYWDPRKPWVPCAAARALGAIGDPGAVEPLIGALGDKHCEVRRVAVEVLWAFGDARAVEPLIGALGDEDLLVRCDAVGALQAFGDARAVEALIGAFIVDLDVESRASDAVAKLGLVLERSSQGIDAGVLRRVCMLKDQFDCWSYDVTAQCIGNPEVSGVISCSWVKQLARQELVRRGLRA